ncbi:2-oxoacid:ferredoxin oxidoreductase subunit gamma [Bacteroidota bacterium]
MKNLEIKLSGFGGQGIVLAGYILGKAASLYDKKNATLTQSYGPESRGGACSAQVVISEEEVDYPEVLDPDILVTMSKEAYDKYLPNLKANGILLYDEDLVENNKVLSDSNKAYAIPATRFAEELGRKIVANIIMLGFLTSITRIIKQDSMKKAIENSIPKGTEELNLTAFQRGYDYGVNILKAMAK